MGYQRILTVGRDGALTHIDAGDLAPEALNPSSLVHALEFRRAYKSDYEVECLRRASRIAAAGHLAAREAFAAGAAELDIHLAYLGANRQTDRGLECPVWR